MKKPPRFSKLRVESLEERTLLAVVAGGLETAVRTVAPTESATWVVNTLEDSWDWGTDDDVVSLREAIDCSADGDRIIFDESLTGGRIVLQGRDNRLEINHGITIDASGVGGITVDGNQKGGCFVIGSNDGPVELIYLTITNGRKESGSGAGISFLEGTLVLTNCTITDNYTNDDGGGICQSWSESTSSFLTLINCTISNNQADNGGGIYSVGGDLVITNSVMADNLATIHGGAIYGTKYLTITNSTISGNSAGNGLYGGAVYNQGTLTLINSTLSGNTASYGGGVYNFGTLTLTNSTLSGNTAQEGGGIYNDSGTLTLANSVITGNIVNNWGRGGGIYTRGKSALKIINSTISGNIAINGDGGGIYKNGGTLTLTNSIVSHNCAAESSDIRGSYSGSINLIGVDPGFVVAPLFEDWTLVNADELDLSLTSESIAIDHGTNDVVETEIDMAGNPRIFAAWCETPTVDIGAYEYQERIDRSTVVTTELDIVDETDGLVSLREAVLNAGWGETIIFDESLTGKTIILNGTQLEIYGGIRIDASAIGGITIDAYDQSRVFYITGGDEIGPVPVLELIGLTITGGWTEENGGGIYNHRGTLTLTNSTVSHSSAYSGGGIYSGGNLTVINSTVAQNDVNNTGGGIYNDGILRLTGSLITENVATNYGGGVYNSGALTVADSAVTENTGYGIYNYSGDLTLTNSVIKGNIGYGIYNRSTLILTDSIIAGNTGNGIYNTSATLTVTNSTIAGNNGGIYNVGTLALTNSIVSFNDMNGGINISHTTPITSRNNIVGLDPGFVVAPIFENGTLVNLNELDLSLTATSIAIDNGDNSLVDTNTDVAGNPRIVAAWRETPTVDIGACEYQATVPRSAIEAPSTVVTTELDILDETDGLISLREAISYAAEGDTVTFDPSLTRTTIVLAGAELTVDKNLTIDASAVDGITIDGNGKSRVFYICNPSDRITVNLTALAIRGGYGNGGGVYNCSGCTLSLTNCSVTGNYSYGIDNDSGTITATNSTFTCNFLISNGTVTFYNSIITGSFSTSNSRLYAYNTLSTNFTSWTRSSNCPVYDYYKPLFADSSHGNYSLAENSQAINMGNNDYVTTETDLAGNPRIIDDVVDIGAYEYQNNSEFDPTVVTTLLDISDPYDGLISLREAISEAETGDVITFDDSLVGGTITLNGEQLEINNGISIDATSVGGITINADGKGRVFYISGGDETAPVELINLRITGGNVTYASDGGGIFVDAGRVLKITNTTITGNYSKYGGGGISNNGLLTITTSFITNNSGGEGGGILTYDGKLTITNSLISANSARYGGGGIYNYYSEVSIVNSTISANTANKFGGGIYNEADLVLTNSIVALNFAHGDEDILGAYSGENNLIGVDPSFVVSPVYRQGDLVNADEIDLSLTARSVAINAGMNEVVETETDVAGNPRIVNGIVDLGAYEYQGAIPSEQLTTPMILTGNKGVYVSAGADRHQITWDAIENAVGYELTYTSDNRDGWISVITPETSAVITGLTYGDEVSYRVRALGEGSYSDSEWSEGKSFAVCPMDVNGDGDIGGIDRVILAQSWLAEEGEDDYIPAADIDGNGDVGGIDRAFLANNWLNEVGVDDMIYPRPQAADVVFSEFASADLAADLDVF